MNKTFGKQTDFSSIKEDGSRVIISYDYEELDNGNATWREVYFNTKKTKTPSFEMVKEAIFEDINAQTNEAILTGFKWNDKPVYLSEANQKNFSEAQRVAQMTEGKSLHMKFKLGEDEEGNPVYHTFTTVNALTQFYAAIVEHINACLLAGWTKKDGIDFSVFESLKKEER